MSVALPPHHRADGVSIHCASAAVALLVHSMSYGSKQQFWGWLSIARGLKALEVAEVLTNAQVSALQSILVQTHHSWTVLGDVLEQLSRSQSLLHGALVFQRELAAELHLRDFPGDDGAGWLYRGIVSLAHRALLALQLLCTRAAEEGAVAEVALVSDGADSVGDTLMAEQDSVASGALDLVSNEVPVEILPVGDHFVGYNIETDVLFSAMPLQEETAVCWVIYGDHLLGKVQVLPLLGLLVSYLRDLFLIVLCFLPLSHRIMSYVG
mmetsp:Transcript_1282/g.1552  ORF Transcript_1282/g.1552 Transcript_1282/m.1552 type:complete len:267 (-) Transcript_1282:434-1234(-)|eukprot:CAMPEP_0170483054 /NCGR_PEP_ID=MMETSP0208-20121228/2797_1 /TAXON_ID=197538 /ORGANISM="Strombidium inclinatum, Strain S3" /LENGTH=266 /DNA_ID=CAMNT_0010755955 /DNA_START=1591 /DNA_END=2391 /DNA_ORIENTATION=-